MTQDAHDQLEELATSLASFLDEDDQEQAQFDKEIRRRRPVMYPDEAVPMDPQFDSDMRLSPITFAMFDNMAIRGEVRGEVWVHVEATASTWVQPLSTLEPGEFTVTLMSSEDWDAGAEYEFPANEGVITIKVDDTTG